MAAYAVQGYAPKRDTGRPLQRTLFAASTVQRTHSTTPRSRNGKRARMHDLGLLAVLNYPYGLYDPPPAKVACRNHGFTHWWTMFSPRQRSGCRHFRSRPLPMSGNHE